MLNVTVMKFPRAMDHLAVLFDLPLCQRRATFSETMRSHWHDVSRTVRKPDAGPGKRNLHHVFRKVTGGMQHVLMSGGDVAAGRVIVCAEMSSDTPSFRGAKQPRKIDLAAMINDRLRGFDHHLKLQTASSQTCLLLELCEQCGESRHLFRNSDLRQGHDEVVRQTAVVQLNKTGDKNVERTNAARSQFFIKRLDANADEGRQRALLTSVSSFGRSRDRVSVLFFVRPVSVTVFKVDAKVFDGFSHQFVCDSSINRVGQPRAFLLFPCLLGIVIEKLHEVSSFVKSWGKIVRPGQIDGPGEGDKVRSKLIQRTLRERT